MAPGGKDEHELKELQIARMALVKDRTRLLNRVKSQVLAFTRRQTRARLAQVERQLTALEVELKTRLRQCQKRARAHDIQRSTPASAKSPPLRSSLNVPRSGRWSARRPPVLQVSPQ